VLLLEADLLYDARFLFTAVSQEGSVLLTADCTGSGDEVFVASNPQGWLTDLGKYWTRSRRAGAIGELAGISRLTMPLLLQMASYAAGDPLMDYEHAIVNCARAGHRIRVVHCPGLAWTEIDNVSDLNRAQTEIWPRLVTATCEQEHVRALGSAGGGQCLR